MTWLHTNILCKSKPNLANYRLLECEARREHLENLDLGVIVFSRMWHEVLLFLCPMGKGTSKRKEKVRVRVPAVNIQRNRGAIEEVGEAMNWGERDRVENWIRSMLLKL